MPVEADDLKRVPLFADLTDRQLRGLAKQFRERNLLRGTTPVREGTMSGIGFFVIADGEASVSSGGNVLRTIGPGDHFGELALVSETERTATVTADTDLRVLEIPFYDFRNFALANPEIMWTLLRHVVGLLDRDGAQTPPS